MREDITRKTAIYGIMGKPLNHSLSPKIHNTVFRRAGIDAVYLPFPVEPERLAEAVAGLPVLSISGVNVTIPHKEAVVACLDQVDDDARAIGAVNTITVMHGKLRGSNTDWRGFNDSLERYQFNPAGRRAAVLGSGGSARAVLYALGEKNCKEIELFNRTFEKAAATTESFNRLFPGSRFKACRLEDFFQDDYRRATDEIPELLIDTLPGTIPFDPPGWLQKIGKPAVFYTVNYGPGGLQKKAPAGWERLDGLDMLVRQAMRSFLIWMGNRFTLAEAEKLYMEVYRELESSTESGES